MCNLFWNKNNNISVNTKKTKNSLQKKLSKFCYGRNIIDFLSAKESFFTNEITKFLKKGLNLLGKKNPMINISIFVKTLHYSISQCDLFSGENLIDIFIRLHDCKQLSFKMKRFIGVDLLTFRLLQQVIIDKKSFDNHFFFNYIFKIFFLSHKLKNIFFDFLGVKQKNLLTHLGFLNHFLKEKNFKLGKNCTLKKVILHIINERNLERQGISFKSSCLESSVIGALMMTDSTNFQYFYLKMGFFREFFLSFLKFYLRKPSMKPLPLIQIKNHLFTRLLKKGFYPYHLLIFFQSIESSNINQQPLLLRQFLGSKVSSFFFLGINAHPLINSLKFRIKSFVY